MDTTAASLLLSIEKQIKNQEELGYFWTHSVRYSCIIEKIIKHAAGKKLVVLDIGCFPYHIGKALEMLGHTVYGIASSHEPIENKRIKVLNIENDRFPFKDNFFDFVLCNEVVEHLPQSPVFPLKEIYRVTKKGGLCMITTPNIARSINRVKILFGQSIMFPISVYFENEGKGNNIYHRHNREYTLSELSAVVLKCNWNIIEKERFISYTPFRKRVVKDSAFVFLGKCINYLTMLVIPSFKDTLFVLSKKN